MRFLQLTKKFPYPLYDGESLLISDFNKILKNKVDKIDLLAFNTIKHYYKISNLPDIDNHYNNINEVFLDNRIHPVAALKNLFSVIPYNISRFIQKDFNEKLTSILQENSYDFILMESIFLLPYVETIRKYSGAKIILRSHNVEYEIWQRIAKNSKNFLLKIYITYLAKKLKKYELKSIKNIDYLVTLTKRDLDKYRLSGLDGKAMVIPAGIIFENIQEKIKFDDKLELSFIGSLDWMPNIEGINWFVKNVWKKFTIQYPQSVLHIAGRNTPDSVYKLENKNIIVHGEVPDSKRFLNSFPITIVPLLSGSGMRLKILEALSLGRIVVTTTIGLEGIDALDRQHVLIADTPEQFIEKMEFCIQNKNMLPQISHNAISLFREKYDLEQTVSRFLNFISS